MGISKNIRASMAINAEDGDLPCVHLSGGAEEEEEEEVVNVPCLECAEWGLMKDRPFGGEQHSGYSLSAYLPDRQDSKVLSQSRP